MALTATLVEQGHNRLRYLLTCDTTGGATLTITTTGGATPDLKTDSLYGPVKTCALAFANGLGKLPAGALNQAQSRAIWMADNSNTVLGDALVPRCRPSLTLRDGSAIAAWTVDANVDGGGHPTVVVTAANTGNRYLDIETDGAIGI